MFALLAFALAPVSTTASIAPPVTVISYATGWYYGNTYGDVVGPYESKSACEAASNADPASLGVCAYHVD